MAQTFEPIVLTFCTLLLRPHCLWWLYERVSLTSSNWRKSVDDREKNELAMYLSSKFRRARKFFSNCSQVFISSKIFHFHDFSTVAQKCHGNFRIQFDSRQFQFTHGNFNSIWLTAISIYSRQRSRHFSSLRSPPINYGGRSTGTNSYRYEFMSVSIHFFSGMRLHGTGLKMNSDRSDFISVADPTRVTFVRDWNRTVLM